MNDIPVQAPLYEVVTEIEALNDDHKNRIINMVYGNKNIDHEGRYTDPQGDSHKLAKIHFTHKVFEDVPGADTTIDGVDAIRFDAPINIYLEDDAGVMTGMKAAKGEIESHWYIGIILKDETGQGWFCGYDEVPTNDHTTTAPDAPVLRKLSLEVPDIVARSYGDLSEGLPVEGEFHIAAGDDGVVTGIPWMSRYADTRPDESVTPEQQKYRESEREVVDQILERIAALEAEATVDAGI